MLPRVTIICSSKPSARGFILPSPSIPTSLCVDVSTEPSVNVSGDLLDSQLYPVLISVQPALFHGLGSGSSASFGYKRAE